MGVAGNSGVAATGPFAGRAFYAREIAAATAVFAFGSLVLAAARAPFVGGFGSIFAWMIFAGRARRAGPWASAALGAWTGFVGALTESVAIPKTPASPFDGMQICQVDGASASLLLWPLLGAGLSWGFALARAPWVRGLLALAGTAVAFWIAYQLWTCKL